MASQPTQPVDPLDVAMAILLKLPKELKDEIAAKIDTKRLIGLSGISKPMRAAVSPELFSHYNPEPKDSALTLPPGLAKYVRSAHFTIEVVNKGSQAARPSLIKTSNQLSVAPLFSKLQTLQMNIWIGRYNEDLGLELAQPIEETGQIIAYLCSHRTAAITIILRIDARVVKDLSARLVTLLAGLKPKRPIHLRLTDLHLDSHFDASLEDGLCCLLTNTHTLHVEDMNWNNCLPRDVHNLRIEHLKVSDRCYGWRAQNGLDRLIPLIRHTSGSLVTLDLDIRGTNHAGTGLCDSVPGWSCPSLRYLHLKGTAWKSLAPILDSLTCSHAVLDLDWQTDLESLSEFLEHTRHWPNLHTLEVNHVYGNRLEWQEVQQSYSRLEQAATQRSIIFSVTLNVRSDEAGSLHDMGNTLPLLQMLRDTASNLLEVRATIPNVNFCPLEVYGQMQEIELARCRSISIESADILEEMLEEEDDGYFERLGVTSEALASLLRLIRALEVSTLDLTVNCPTGNALKSMCQALQRDAWPKLARIRGQCRLTGYTGKETWKLPHFKAIKAAFVKECAERYIDITDFYIYS